MKRVLCGLVGLVLLLGGARKAEADYIYTTIDVPGSVNSPALGINNADQIVGSYDNGPFTSNPQGFLYRGGSYTTFQVEYFGTFPRGINDSAQITGWQTVLLSNITGRTTYAGFLLPLPPTGACSPVAFDAVETKAVRAVILAIVRASIRAVDRTLRTSVR